MDAQSAKGGTGQPLLARLEGQTFDWIAASP